MCNNNNCTCCPQDDFVVQEPGSYKNNITKSTGDSRAIRIGNDIKLDVTIQELNGMDIINIKSLKCIIVNTTPMLGDNHGTAYEIHRCGLPTYHVHPAHQCWGYGIHPCAPKNWFHGIYPHHQWMFHNPYGCHHLIPIPVHNKPFEFIAPVKALPERNKVRVFFPASAQMLCGLYSLTFIIELYEPGYHCNDLRTVTVDYNNIFELVPNMEGAAGNITIDIDKYLGVNVYDNHMFGNTDTNKKSCCCNCNNQWIENGDDNEVNLNDMEIDGPSSLQVGKSAWYSCMCDGKQIGTVKWRLIGNTKCANIPVESANKVLVNAVGITDVIKGEGVVYLECSTTDGSNVVKTKEIKIHNYATDIFIGNYGDRIDVPFNSSVTDNLYVLQEDGTRVCVCDFNCDCQSVSVGDVTFLNQNSDGYDDRVFCTITFGTPNGDSNCTWDYDDVHSNTESQNSQESDDDCCKDQQITIRNNNHALNPRIIKVRLTSKIKNSGGEFPTRDIEIHLDGSKESNGGNADDPGNDYPYDMYVNSGSYNEGTLSFVNTDSNKNFDIDVSELQNQDPWFTAE